MKNKSILTIAAFIAMGAAGCSKKFLEEKRDLSGVNEEVFRDSTLATAYVDYVYGMFQPNSGVNANLWNISSDKFSQTTDELAGETNWNKVWPAISYTNGHALEYFGVPVGNSLGNNTWTRMKQINKFLDNIDNYGLPEQMRKQLKGQLYFWRAYQYFDLVRLYGGVPLVLHAQEPLIEEGDADNKVPRSKSSETIDQICADLDSARLMLPPRWPASQYGRITSCAAAAMKGRVLLTWASPLFNRADDRARWQRAYDACLAAKTLLDNNQYGLYKTGNMSDGTAWENMFTTETNNPEAILVFGFNNTSASSQQKNNDYENQVRPKEISGGGGISPTKQLLDAFPMKDGKKPGESSYAYDQNKFYKNRDPRFYKTFAYNGALWPYQGNANFRIWTYRWFQNASDANPGNSTERRGFNGTGVYLRKATSRTASNSIGDFKLSGTDFMEIRYAEVLLNLAEAAIGSDKVPEGIGYVALVRERAGIDNTNNYGLAGITDRDAAFATVINERRVEFAYEGKRFWDLRRWMLFNNDFGTCTRLQQTPLEGTRRTGIFIYVKKLDSSKFVGKATADPLYKPQNTEAATPVLDEREPLGLNAAQMEAHIDGLYDKYFAIKEKDDLEFNAAWRFKWYNQYYFFGLHQKIIVASPYLEQTKDWNGLSGAGTFDPLQ